MSVGGMAESAAGGDRRRCLLLQVASYYHDIGKTIRPYFFTDNQSDRENVHNELDAHQRRDHLRPCDRGREDSARGRPAASGDRIHPLASRHQRDQAFSTSWRFSSAMQSMSTTTAT
ncbi:MAG: hypothetical protein U0Z44_11150 [Kouleothrix sp.]